MHKKIFAGIIGALLTISLVGCGTPQSNNKSQNNEQQPLAKAFQDELSGFTTIEQDINKGDYTSAITLAGTLHNEFHASIHASLTEKRGKTYSDEIHGKYDELQDAITSKNNSKIAELIKVNRDNLYTVAKILDVSIKK